MKFRHLLFASVVPSTFIAGLSLSAAPLVSIGDNATVHFLGSAKVTSDSNIFRDETDEVDDIVFSVTPGLELKYGTGASSASFGAVVKYEIRRYDDNGELDTELLNTSAYGKYEGARFKANGNVAYVESKSNTGSANVDGDLIEAETITATFDSEYRLSQKFKFGAGLKYTDKDYTSFEDAVADYQTLALPFDLYYELTPKLDLSAGFTYTDKEVEDREGAPGSGYDSDVYFYNVGLRGDLLPKLTGFVKVGYKTLERDGADDKNTMGVDADLTWKVSPKFTNKLMMARDFGIAGNGSATERSSVRLNSTYTITTQYSVSGVLGYLNRDYQDASGREDDQYEVGGTFSYIPNEFWRFSAGYTYLDNDSSDAGQSYEDHRLDLTASLRY